MSLDETNSNDVVTTVDQFNFIVDQELDGMFEEIKVDYRNNWFGRGFAVSVVGGAGGSCS